MESKIQKLNNLIRTYEDVINQYTKLFCKKHDLNINDVYWIGDKIGEVCSIGDYYFNFSDIKLDIDQQVDKDKIIEWYDYSLEIAMEDSTKRINYENYLKGARIEEEKVFVILQTTSYGNTEITVGEGKDQDSIVLSPYEFEELKRQIKKL